MDPIETPQAQRPKVIDASGLRTMRQIIKAVPPSWHDAELAVANSIGMAKSVRRISLHRTAAGRRVVLIHEDDLS